MRPLLRGGLLIYGRVRSRRSDDGSTSTAPQQRLRMHLCNFPLRAR